MNDLTFGATLLACFAATVITVWMESTSTQPNHVGAVVSRSHEAPAREAKSRDQACTTAIVAASASAE
jgi:hypothetical protein